MADNEQTEQPLTFKLITKEVKTKYKGSDIAEEFRSLGKSKALHDDKLIKEHFDIDADVSDASEYETKKLTRGTKYKKDEELVLLSDYESSPSYSSSEYIDSDEEYVKTKTHKKKVVAKKSKFPSKVDKTTEPENSYKGELLDIEDDEDDYNMYTVEEIRKNKNYIFGAMNDFFQRRPNFIQPKRRAEIDTMKSSSLVSNSDKESIDKHINPENNNKTKNTVTKRNDNRANEKEVYNYIKTGDGFSVEKIDRRIEKQVLWVFNRAFKPEYHWFFYLKEHNYNFLDYLRQDLKTYLTESFIQKHNLDPDLLTPDKNTTNDLSRGSKKYELPESLVVVKMLSSSVLLDELKKAIANFFKALYNYGMDINILQRNLIILHDSNKSNRKSGNINKYSFISRYNFIRYKTLEGSVDKFESAIKATFGSFENFLLRLIKMHKLFTKEYSLRASLKQNIIRADLKEKGMEIKEWMDSVDNITSIEYVRHYLNNLEITNKNTETNNAKISDEDKGIEQYYKEREQEKVEQLEDFFSLLGDDKTLSNNIMAVEKYSTLLDYSSNSVANGEIISERIWEHNYNRLNAILDRKSNYKNNIHLEDELKRFTRNLDFADIGQVEEKAVHIMAERIKNNPIIKSFVYGLYLNHGILNTEPTSEGKKHMDINHPLINVKRIENKPINAVLLEGGVRWKQVLEAKDKGLIIYKFGFKKEDFVIEQLLNLYREISGEIDHWDKLREKVIVKACKFMLVEIEQMIVKKLDVVSQKYICKIVSEHILDNYTRKTRLLKSNIDDDLADLDSFRTSEWDKRVCVLMRVSGDEDHVYGAIMTSSNIEHLFVLKHLIYYQKVKNEDEVNEIKQDDLNLFKILMDKYEPDSILVDSMNITIQDRLEIEHALSFLVNKPKIEPLIGEVALSPIVSSRFVEPVVRNWNTLVDKRHWGSDTGTYYNELAKVVSLGFFFFHTNEITKYFLSYIIEKLLSMERTTTFIDSYISNTLNCTFKKCVTSKGLVGCFRSCIQTISVSEGMFIDYKLKFPKESVFSSTNKLFNDDYNSLKNIKTSDRKNENITSLYPEEFILKILGKLFNSEYNNVSEEDIDNDNGVIYRDLFSSVLKEGVSENIKSLNEANDIIHNNNLYMNKLPYLCPQNGVIADLFRVPFCKYETYFAVLFVFLEHSTKLISAYLNEIENRQSNNEVKEITRKGKRTTDKKKIKECVENMSDFEKIIHELMKGHFTFLNNYMLKRKLVLFNKISSFSNNYKDILQQLSESSHNDKIKKILALNSNLYNDLSEIERIDLLAIFQDIIKRFLLFGITYAIKGEPTTKHLVSTNPQNETEFNTYKENFLNNTLYGSLPSSSEIFKSKLRTFGIKVGKLVSARVTKVVYGELECVISRQFIGVISTNNFRDKKLDLRGEIDNKESALVIEAFFNEYTSKDSIIQTRILGIDTKNNKLILSSKYSDIEDSITNTNNFYTCIDSSENNQNNNLYNTTNFNSYSISNINKYNINSNLNYNNTVQNYNTGYTTDGSRVTYNDKRYRIINEKYLNLNHEDDKIDNIEKEKLIKTSKENLIRASQNRQCDLFYFKNFSSYQQIKEEMESRQDGSYLVHPHPEHFNRLVVCIKLNTKPLLILKLHILEEGKTKETILEIGTSLKILGIKNSKIYQSIEDLVYNYILGISEKLLVVRQHKRFRYGIEGEVETNMKEEFKRNKTAAYCLCFSYKRPGVILLVYIIDGNLNVEAIVAEPDGYVFRRQKFSKIDEVVNKFKVDPYKRDGNI